MQEPYQNEGIEGLNKLVKVIIAECKNIHTAVGSNLLAPVYKQMLYQALLKKGFFVQRQEPVYAPSDLQQVEVDMKAEFVVENSVICDIKSVDAILPMHKKALDNFLRLSNKPVGLLINFKAPHLKDGMVKLVNNNYKKHF